MTAVVAAIGLALALVAATQGSWRLLAETHLPHEGAIVVVFVGQAVLRGRFGLPGLAHDWAVTAWGLLCLVLVGLLWPSRGHAGMPVVVLGLAMNLMVVMLNAGMPVRLPGVRSVLEANHFYHAATTTDVMVWGADVLPMPDGWMASVGDLLLLVGVVVFIVAGAHRRQG